MDLDGTDKKITLSQKSFSNKLATPFISDRSSYGSPSFLSPFSLHYTHHFYCNILHCLFYGTHNLSTIIFYHPLSTLFLSLSISPPPPLSPRGMDLFGGCIRRDSDHQCTESTTITSASLRLLASTGPATQSQTTSRLLGLARCCDPPRRGLGPRRPCSFAQLASS